MGCRKQIIRDDKGEIVKVLAYPEEEISMDKITYTDEEGNQTESKLFNSILELPNINTKEEALAIWAQTKTPEFIEWFGDSKVVDENGEPLLVYHGSNDQFSEFKTNFQQENPSIEIEDSGFFFSESKSHPYVKGKEGTYPTFLSANNIKELEGELHHMTAQKANQEKFDGVTGKETYGDKSFKTWAVFKPNQIKSVFNDGEFSEDNNIYQSLSEKDLNFYDSQVNQEETTLLQKQVVENILLKAKKVSLTDDETGYNVRGDEVKFQRVSAVIKSLKKGYFAFNKKEQEEENYNANRDWGNIVHKILEFTVIENPNTKQDIKDMIYQLKAEGKDIDVSDEVIDNLIKSFKIIKNKFPNSIMLSEIPVYNDNIKVAGTIDLIVVHPTGSTDIIDLKSSVDPITKSFTKLSTKGFPVTNSYVKGFTPDGGKRMASKKERHEAQLTIYKSMLENWGIPVDKIGVLPLHITKTDGNNIIEAGIETNNSVYNHSVSEDIYSAFKAKDQASFDKNADSEFINSSLLEGLLATLETQIKIFRKNDNFKEARKIQTIKEKIEVLNTATQLNKLIEELHEIFTAEDGHYAQFMSLVENVKNGLYNDPYEVINELKTYQQEANMYSDLIDDLSLELNKTKVVGEANSSLRKLADLSLQLKGINSQYKKVINPLIADQLTQHVSEDNEVVKNANMMIGKLSNRNEILQAEIENEATTDRRKRRNTATIASNSNKIAKYKLASSDGYRAAVLDQLDKGSYKDISVIEASIIAPIMNSNLLIKSFMRTLKDGYESFRAGLHKLEKDSFKIFKEFENHKGNQNDVAKFNEDIIEKTVSQDGEENYGFVQKIDNQTYSKDRKEIQNEIEEYNKTNSKRKNLNKELYERGLRIRRPNADTTVTNPVTSKQIVLMKGLNTITQDKKEQLTENEYNRWYSNNVATINGKLTLVGKEVTMINDVRYLNPKYTKLEANKPAKKYYDYLLAVHYESQEGLPRKLFHKLPQIEKNTKDRRREQGIVSTAKRKVSTTLSTLEVIDEEDFGNISNKKNDGKSVALLYIGDIGAENVSLDVMSSVLAFREASERYKINYKLQGFSEATLGVVQNNNPLSDNNTGYSEARNKIPGFNKYMKEYNGNNVAAALNSIIDMHIYGKKKELSTLEVFGRKFNMNKLADTLMGAASFTQIGGDPVLAASNSLTANTSVRMEAFGGKHFGFKQWAKAATIYTSNERQFLVDSSQGAKTGKISQLLELYDALQGEYTDEYGRKMTHSKVKKAFSTSTWFSGMHKGEHRAQTKTMLATLLNIDILDNNGNKTNLYEAYEVVDGVLSIKKGYTGIDGKSLMLINTKVKHKVHAIAREAQGVYNDFDKTLLQRHWLGEMLLMYKKFIIPGVTRRFRGLHFSVETEDFTEGYFTTFYSSLRNEGLSMFKQLYEKDSNLTSLEKENIKKTLGEILTMMVFSFLSFAFFAMRAKMPPEKRKMMTYLTYFTTRLTSELAFFNMGLGDVRNAGFPLNINPTLKSFRTPFATYSFVTKMFKSSADAFALISGNGRYERDMKYTLPFLGNIADKGDPKVWKGIAKLIGMGDKLGNMDEALKIIKGFE